MTKRIFLVMGLLATLALAGSPTQAASPRSIPGSSIARSMSAAQWSQARLAAVGLRDVSEGNRDVSEGNQRKSAHQDASLLSLPDAAFTPAVPVQQYTGVVAPSDADQNSFSIFHSATYTSLGMITGYYERADWKPTGSTDTVTFRYQGGVFKTAAAATTAWQDGVTHAQSLSGVKPTDCTSAVQVQCSSGGFVTQNSHLVFYVTIVVNQCLVETAGEVPETFYTAHQDQVNQIQGNITAAGLAAAQAACNGSPGPQPGVTPTNPVDFSLVALSVHKKRKIGDAQAASVKTVKVGKTVYLYIYYEVRTAPTTARVVPTFTLTRVVPTFTLTRNGGVVVTRSFPHALLAPAPNAFYEDVPVKMKKAGTYVFTGRLTIGGQAKQGSVSFKIVK